MKRLSIISIFLLILIALASCAPATTHIITAPGEFTEGDDTTDKLPDITTGGETEGTAEQSTTAPEETTEPQKDPIRISFLAMGDNLIHSPIFKQSLQDDGTYDFSPKYSKIKDLVSKADISFINQETPMCGAEYGYHNYPQFNTPQALGHDLVDLGFDVICFANNHVADMCYTSKSAINDLIDFTETLDALTYGVYRSKEDFDNIRVMEHLGLKIAFLAFTYETNVYGKDTEPSRTDSYIPIYSPETVIEQMSKANELADFIIVSMHWGDEGRFYYNDEQEEYAQLLSDLGADVIIGSHPHVIQPIEWITGESGNKTLCYYSLGNGINCQDYIKNMVGICAEFDIVYDGKDAWVENPMATPVFTYQRYAYKDVYIMPLSELTEDIVSTHHCQRTDRSFDLSDVYEIVTDVIEPEYLPDYLKD